MSRDEPIRHSRAGVDGTHSDFLSNSSRSRVGGRTSKKDDDVIEEEWRPSGFMVILAAVFVLSVVQILPAQLRAYYGPAVRAV